MSQSKILFILQIMTAVFVGSCTFLCVMGVIFWGIREGYRRAKTARMRSKKESKSDSKSDEKSQGGM